MSDQQFDRTGRPSRRSLLQGLAGAAAGLTLAAPSWAAAPTSGPIKIGCLNTFSKAFASNGEATYNGLNLYFEQIGWQSAGRKLEMIKEDDELSTQVGLQKVRKLVESDKVDVICGPLLSNVALAMVNYMRHAQCLWLVPGAGATPLTRERLPYMFRTTQSNWQVAYPMGGWAYDNVAKEVVLAGTDYVTGHDVVDIFKDAFTKRGGKILQELYPPLGTTDFSPYLLEIRAMKAPATYNFYSGTDAVRFVQQYAEYGLKQTTRLLTFQPSLDNDTFGGQGRAALDGLSSSVYCDTLATPENDAFVAAFKKRYKELPSIFAETGYTTGRIFDLALQAVHGNIADKDRFAAAVLATRIVAPRGPVSFEAGSHQAIQDTYIRRVVEIDGQIRNKVIATIPHVRDPLA